MCYAFLTHNTAGLPLDRNWKSQSSQDERAALQQNNMKTNIKAEKWVKHCEKTSGKLKMRECSGEATAALPRAVHAGGQD